MERAGGMPTMSLRSFAFKILNIYSTIWMSAKAKVKVKGWSALPPREPGERRLYLVINHSTTYDLVALMHISKHPFIVLVDRGAFTFPVIRHILNWAGFVPLDKDSSTVAFESCVRELSEGNPLLVSLHDGDSTLGDWGRPRTGGIRIAHKAGATIYPVFLKVEEDRVRHLRFKGTNGTEYPYTTFKDTLYFIEFLPPDRMEDLPADAGYEDYRVVANRMDALANAVEKRYEAFLGRASARFAGLKRSGGTKDRVAW